MNKKANKSKKPINKSTGCKLNRSEIVQVRFNPKLRYALEILAKNEHRTVSSAIETLVSEGIKNHYALIKAETDNEIKHSNGNGFTEISIANALERVWDTNDAARFAQTAFKMPQVLSYEEEKIWHFIKKNDYYWIFWETLIDCEAEDGTQHSKIVFFQTYEMYEFYWEHFHADWDLLKTGNIEAVKQQQIKNNTYNKHGKVIPLGYKPDNDDSGNEELIWKSIKDE